MDASALLPNVPDVPHLVEARGMLLSGDGVVVWTDGTSAILHSPDDLLACVVGSVPATELAEALNQLPRGTEVVIGEEHVPNAGIPGWTGEVAIVHIEPERLAVSPTPGCEVRVLGVGDPLDLSHVPADLRGELEDAFTFSPVAVTCVTGVPVAFCYAGWMTGKLWDVSIDTLESWRNRGYARAAATALLSVMRARGKRAVWAALSSNEPSLRLAARLGFSPVSRVWVLTRRACTGAHSS
jgi:GNAT superfamily N-acetyltransferase